jgi:hypothetical protein
MEDPVVIYLNIAVRYIGRLDLLEVKTSLCHLLVSLNDIYLLGAGIIEPVATA